MPPGSLQTVILQAVYAFYKMKCNIDLKPGES
jgi:hypothetical protein